MILDEIVADKREQLFRDKQKTDLTVMRTLAEEKLREEAAKKENVRILPKMDFPLSENLKMHPQALER